MIVRSGRIGDPSVGVCVTVGVLVGVPVYVGVGVKVAVGVRVGVCVGVPEVLIGVTVYVVPEARKLNPSTSLAVNPQVLPSK